jgi:hypothetical protein
MKFKTASILIVGCIIAFSGCSATKLSGEKSQLLENKWTHAHEEDSDQFKVYHTSAYSFGPSRGRERFTILPDGKLEITPISPNDAPISYDGSWMVDGDILLLQFSKDTLKYEIIDIQTNTLILKAR